MKRYSKKWMQSFVLDKFPEDKIIVEQMSKKAFEVESIEKVTDTDGKIDSLFEIKVLPNRVADAMSLEGMAREMSAVFDFKMLDWRPRIDLKKFKINNEYVLVPEKNTNTPLYRFTGFKVILNHKNNNALSTPEWIKEILIKSGGRSINCLVDITNLILFSMGQPAHVFDFEKLHGKIVTRFANAGEEIVLLDGKKVPLNEEDFLIADEKQALSIAGIKGGKLAEVDVNTKVAYFELANFSPSMIRKTTQRINIRTDASKIFENGVSTQKTIEAMEVCLATVKEIFPSCEIEFITDILIEEKKGAVVEADLKNINNYGGTNLSFEEVKILLERQNFKIEKIDEENFKITPPHERLDINIEEDIAEEVLRIYGFDNLQSKELVFKNNVQHNTRFLFENYLKLKLIDMGFTEVFNYTFVDKGQVKVKLGLASDKEFLRDNLFVGAESAFYKNYYFLPILETEILKFFEIGMVFGYSQDLGEFEEKRCVLVCDDNKKKTNYLPMLENILKEIETEFGLSEIKIIKTLEKPSILEFSIDEIVREINEKNVKIEYKEINKNLQDIKYKQISLYPFIVRDIACWLPEHKNVSDFEEIKTEILNLNLLNIEKIYMFDSFTKKDENDNEKTSIAFRIVFQSYNETLTDEVVEVEMQKVNNYLKVNNFQIR